ncbi:MAG TPA: phosphoglucosamine mutase [Streptosporangiaceae bacterium]|jgi:phosphoglucosamine mutase|nr:phosphoglucosamine mutase [Streptosporangiaceae bacterium]
MGEAGQRGRLFGTDGVRGVAGHDLTASLAMDLSVAAAAVLLGSGPPTAVVGRDPRASGEFLEAAVVAGLAGAGIHVLRLGVVPTPGVAYLTRALGAAFGVVISASHNPAQDNGIKFFGRGGVKLPDAVEDQIEDRLSQGPAPGASTSFGRVSDAGAEQERYLDYLLSTLPGPRALAGLRVVADCAHGAAYRIAPQALRRAGAEVIAIGAEPDGLNINAGYGSTCLGTLAAAVVEHGADAGVAYDGDADRCLAVDADGQLLDGDHILAVLATELKESGRLARDAVVVTVMSNQGFHVAMREAGIEVIETPVGDKYVFAAMRDGGYVLGGEQSGHIILLEHATTGDGILTSLQLLASVNRRGMPMAAVAKMMRKYPQVLVNVPGDASRLGPRVDAAVLRAQTQLGEAGRVLVRPSGTEPAIRLMVQAADADLAEQVIGQLADEIRLALDGR